MKKSTVKKLHKSDSVENEQIEKHGIDFFIDPPERFLIKKKGLNAVKMIRAERD